MEIWKDIDGYEGLYQVSNKGNVWSCKRKRLLQPYTDSNGRQHICIYHNGKCFTHKIHRLVASAFIPNPNGFPEVNHKDENPSNNAVENLEWCDRMYNQHYGTAIARMASSMKGKALGEKSVLSKKVYQFTLEGQLVAEWGSLYEVKRALNINPYNISSCCAGKRNKAGGYRWSHKKALDCGLLFLLCEHLCPKWTFPILQIISNTDMRK